MRCRLGEALAENLPELPAPSGGGGGARQRGQVADHDNVLIQIAGHENVVVVGPTARRDRLSEALRRLDAETVEIPPLLPYLPDRGEQEDAIEDALSHDAPHPLLCIVHGDQYQSHDQLLRRLKEDTLPSRLQLEVAVTASVMGWPQDFASNDQLRRLLLRGLAKELSLGPQAAVTEIDAALQALPGPALIHTYLLSRDLERHGSRLIDAYLELWQSWPELRPGQRLLVLLFVQYQTARGLGPFRRWRLLQVNREISTWLEPPGKPPGFTQQRLQERFDRLMVRVLPRLQGVTETEAETWALSSRVARVCHSPELIADIKKLYREYEEPRIPMDTLASELRSLLVRHCRKETFG
jgi:hypothetical protein